METLNYWLNQWYVALALIIWSAVWDGIGLWRSAKKDHKYWFLIIFADIFLIRSLGLVPIIYLKFFADKQPPVQVPDADPILPPPARLTASPSRRRRKS